MESLISGLESGQDLSSTQIATSTEFLLDDQADQSQKARFLKALALKGESASEIAEFVRLFLKKATQPAFINHCFQGPTIDVCGTGGDKLNLFNVSTTSMFVVAAAGGVVIKHGNRGITSKSGGADVLEALGIAIDLPSEKVGECLERAGVGFLFAPLYHPAFKAIVPVRQALAQEGQRTIFNLIGPLLNPASPDNQLVGVFDESLCPLFADILKRLGRKSAWVVNGKTETGNVVDELSLMGETKLSKYTSTNGFSEQQIRPQDFGLKLAHAESLQGGDASQNASILEGVLSGELQGPKRDMVCLNAGAAIACAGLSRDLQSGIELANELLTQGEALRRLRLLQEIAKS